MLNRIKLYLELVKFEHSIFALPFAYIGAVLAQSAGFPKWDKILFITLAMIGARTFGMCMNRLADLRYDKLNPRTKDWPLPKGLIAKPSVIALMLASLFLFLYSGACLNKLALMLTPIAIFLLTIYPFLKRISFASHFGLGMVLGCAPIGGWIGIKGELGLIPLLLGAAVMLWVSAFDIIYAFLDIEFDKEHSLKSIPVAFGMQRSLAAIKGMHIACLLLLIAIGVALKVGFFYWAGIAIAAAILKREHRLILSMDAKSINAAFFKLNGALSIALFVFTIIDRSLI